MKRYTAQMTSMRELLHPLFSSLTLNKAGSKYAYVSHKSYYTKGVKSDFVAVFNSAYVPVSFALTFNYIGLSPANQSVSASIKLGKENDAIESSLPMSIEDFARKITSFNSWLKEHSKNYQAGARAFSLKANKEDASTIINKFSELFMENKMDLEKQIKDGEQYIEDFKVAQANRLKLPELQQAYQNKEAAHKQAQQAVYGAIEQSPQYLELKQLMERMKVLKEHIGTHEKNLKAHYKLDQLEKDMQQSLKTLTKAQDTVDRLVEDEIHKIPGPVASRLGRTMKR